MPRKTLTEAEVLAQLPLVQALQPEVGAWRNQGRPGVTQTTADLFHYWFDRGDGVSSFYECQRYAIETLIYCHEILGATTLRHLYDRVAPSAMAESAYLQSEVDAIPFPKYGLKMATGSGKTWVLAALVLWQYFNALNGERPGRFSPRFVIVAPGKEVLNRLLDSIKGRRSISTGNRDPQTSDYKSDLFMPEGVHWRGRFHLDVFEPNDIRTNATAPEGPFVLVTNWQQFRLKKDKSSVWDQITGADIEEQPRGEVLADFLSEFSDLVVMNDEAHHVHAKRGKENEELVWRKFMNVLHGRLLERHPDDHGLFLQIDYSATPFYGSGHKREYFPHIIYDYPLLDATRDMLVKQLFLEQRQAVAGERLGELDFRAVREDEGHHRGAVVGLSAGQKVILDIGRRKLEQLATEFAGRGISKKPVMMVLCEQTEVAELVLKHFATLVDDKGRSYDHDQVMRVHTDLSDADLEGARKRLDTIDDNSNPLRVVVSVLMLREGFDKKNISVIAVLRATEADLLLEQVVGRGLRLMFPESEEPQIWEAKKEAIELLRKKRQPSNSFDFLFVVEHPRFRQFYQDLRNQGYLIGEGDTTQVRSTGDLISVDAMPERIPLFDISWPAQIYDQGKLPDIATIDADKISVFGKDFDALKKQLSHLVIQDVHVESGLKAKTWKLENAYFDFSFFLAQAATAISKEGRDALLTGRKAEIARLVDAYVSTRLFGREIDFSRPENYTVLNYTLVFDHVVESVRRAVLQQVEAIRFEVRAGEWRKLSDLARIFVRQKASVEVTRCIYPRISFSAVAGGLERDFMLEVLEQSPEVLAFAKLDRKHPLKISYRDKSGIQRDYEVDFIVKTDQSMYLVETKSDRDLESATVGLKARAAQSWCETASTVAPPAEFNQPQQWQYLIVAESIFKANRSLSFDALAPFCHSICDQIVAREEKRLFL
jgi:type III restriction enzyme